MNVSGLVVTTTPAHFDSVMKKLESAEFCDLHFTDNNHTFIVTVEGASAEQETQKLRQIQAIDHVISAEMVYAYAEDELTQLRADVTDQAGEVPKFLADDSLGAEQAHYGGNVNHLLHT